MKTIHSILANLLISSVLVFASGPTTPEQFTTAFNAALKEKSAEKLDALTYTIGMTDADKEQVKLSQKMIFSDKEIDSISLQPLPEDYETVYIMQGKKIEPTYPPAGIIKTTYANPGHGLNSTSAPYAIVDGRYYLITSKSTDLGWTGPKDKTITFMVMGRSQNKVQIKAKWNASGVDQERIFKSPSSNFPGQFFQQIIVTSTDNDTDVTLTILEAGKEIFVSQPLKGKGVLEYKK